MQSKQIIETLKSSANLKFLGANLGENPEQLALNKSLAKVYPLQAISQILHLYNKANRKLPYWVENFCALSPKAYEQSSSESTAKFKASLFSGENMLNLTGGLGVDDVFMAQSFNEVTSVEMDSDIHEMAEFNMGKMGVENMNRVLGSAEDFINGLDTDKRFDLVYIDPDRRPGSSGRAFLLSETVPNVLEMKEQLLRIAPKVLIKASPMLDITLAIRELENVNRVLVVSLDGEVKELLIELQEKSDTEVTIEAVDLATSVDDIKRFSGEPNQLNQKHWSPDSKYFFAFSPALIKAELCSSYALEKSIAQPYFHSAYGFGNSMPEDFMGRCFEIGRTIPFSKKTLNQYLKDTGIEKTNLASRNFPLKPAEIKQKFGLNDGGEDYLFFFRDGKQHKWCVHAKRIEP